MTTDDTTRELQAIYDELMGDPDSECLRWLTDGKRNTVDLCCNTCMRWNGRGYCIIGDAGATPTTAPLWQWGKILAKLTNLMEKAQRDFDNRNRSNRKYARKLKRRLHPPPSGRPFVMSGRRWYHEIELFAMLVILALVVYEIYFR